MLMNAWDELVKSDVNALLNSVEGAHNDDEPTRPWPPVMIRDFIRAYGINTREVDAGVTIGYIADCLAESPWASIAVYDEDRGFLGIAVDEDVMALIKRDGVRALDYPIAEAVQRNRPVCSVTDSPYVILQMMRSKGWDRIGVSEHGRLIGVLQRRDLVKFTGS
ncbi:MAG: CBS domain-containing protein [Rhodospirillales bacterium]